MPEKFVVVYLSKYGSSKQYAHWLAQALGADLFDGDGLHIKDLKEYTTIVFGCGIYAGRLPIASLIKKAASSFPDKKLVLFTVGLTDLSNAEYFRILLQNNLHGACPPAFHFPGQMNIKDMKLFNRMMIKLFLSSQRKKPPEQLTENDRTFLQTGQSGQLNRSAITPLITYIRNE